MKISEVEWIHEKLEEAGIYSVGVLTDTERFFLRDLLDKILEKYTYEDRETNIEVVL